jgi:hypothetical protein
MKNKKHDKIINMIKNNKSKVLEKHANKLLKQDEKNQKLKEKKINIDILKLFK